MQTLRGSRHLCRFVLAWFVVVIIAAVAGPLSRPGSTDVVCSASGHLQVVVLPDSGGHEHADGNALDCPLCMGSSLIPPVAQVALPVVQPLAHAMRPVPAARIAALTRAPLPARGPPALS